MKIVFENKEKNKPVQLNSPPFGQDSLKTSLAIGTLTFYITALVLFLVNSAIYNNYHPDVEDILDKVVPQTLYPPSWFKPEPVERLQFLLSAVLTPFIIFGSFTLTNKLRTLLNVKPKLCTSISLTGLAVFAIYLLVILNEHLVQLPNETNAYFFNNSIANIFSPYIAIPFYCLLGYLIYYYYIKKETVLRKNITRIITYSIVGLIIVDMVLYDFFNLASVPLSTSNENNPVFYAITQVFAGKSLLVDINCQYGLYAWMLLPLFKLIGLSSCKMGLVFATLNGISFTLIYLGIKKIVKQDLISFLVFACLVYWQFWQSRIPLDEGSRFYYQYNPIRTLFPSIAFYLIATYGSAAINRRRILLPLIALTSSLAIFWNLDTGIVVYAASFLALIFSSLDAASWKNSIKKSLINSVWMIGSLFVIIIIFFLSTKLRAGQWPDFKQSFSFQGIFYISGFFMLPMTAVHFWNLPIIVYLSAGIYCIYDLNKKRFDDLPVMVFLFILGIGVFSYFQGRSHDTIVPGIMYPSIIILGVFCNRLMVYFLAQKPRLHEGILFFLIPFIFVADGACTMIYYTPSISSFAWNNAFSEDKEKEEQLATITNFLKDNVPPKDTVLIIAKNYEAYYYAYGQYYNPLSVASSTELIFKSELNATLDFIRTTKYPIVCDTRFYWPYFDTIMETLSKYTSIQKSLPDYSMLLLEHGKINKPKLAVDKNTIYYNALGDFNKFLRQATEVIYPENFTIEFIARLDTNKLIKNNILFATLTKKSPFTGLIMKQDGDDLTHYQFKYGNGTEWCQGVICQLDPAKENHVIIKVEKNIIVAFNNDNFIGTVNTNSQIRNGDGLLIINPTFSGTLEEMKVSNL